MARDSPLITMKLIVKKRHPDAKLPVYATDGAACFDLHAMHVAPIREGLEVAFVTCGRSAVFRTGLAFEVPPGWAMMVYSRSGHGFKNDTRLANCVGIIDSDFRGELMVKLTCDSELSLPVREGDRIAQAMLVPVERVEFELAEELSETARGSGGLGSTGA